MVLGSDGSGGQLQKVVREGVLTGPLSSEFSRDRPSSMCPLVMLELVREVVVVTMLGSGGGAEDVAAASCTNSPLSTEDGEEGEPLAGSRAKVWRSSSFHSSISSCPFYGGGRRGEGGRGEGREGGRRGREERRGRGGRRGEEGKERGEEGRVRWVESLMALHY